MSERWRNKLLKYGITGAVCLGIAVFYCSVREFGRMELVERYRTLCDAFTIPGVLAICIGLLLWLSNEGAFYGIGYVLSFVKKAFVPGAGLKSEKYYDYVTRQRENKVTGFAFLFISGGVCMAIAIVCMVLFYQLY